MENGINLRLQAREVLLELSTLLSRLNFDEYTFSSTYISNSTVGEHSRHVIELFQQLFTGYYGGVINYDQRERKLLLQTDIDAALLSIANLILELDKPEKELRLVSVYNNHEAFIPSSYNRELMFNIEHCIHHQALIKVALYEQGLNLVDESFGVAKSTLMYRENVHSKLLQ